MTIHSHSKATVFTGAPCCAKIAAKRFVFMRDGMPAAKQESLQNGKDFVTCPNCGPVHTIETHGHYQCEECGAVCLPCCQP